MPNTIHSEIYNKGNTRARINLSPTSPTAIYPANSSLINISSHLIKSPDVNLKARTPIRPPVITKRSWSLMATAAATLSIENAKSVKAIVRTVRIKLLCSLLIWFISCCKWLFSTNFAINSHK